MDEIKPRLFALHVMMLAEIISSSKGCLPTEVLAILHNEPFLTAQWPGERALICLTEASRKARRIEAHSWIIPGSASSNGKKAASRSISITVDWFKKEERKSFFRLTAHFSDGVMSSIEYGTTPEIG